MRVRFAELDGMILKTQLFIVLIVAPAKKLWPWQNSEEVFGVDLVWLSVENNDVWKICSRIDMVPLFLPSGELLYQTWLWRQVWWLTARYNGDSGLLAFWGRGALTAGLDADDRLRDLGAFCFHFRLSTLAPHGRSRRPRPALYLPNTTFYFHPWLWSQTALIKTTTGCAAMPVDCDFRIHLFQRASLLLHPSTHG